MFQWATIKLNVPYWGAKIKMPKLQKNCITALFCLFVGPWSDKFGRKPLILSPLLGYTLGFLALVVISLFPNASPWYFVISSLPVCMTGGVPTFITGVLSHITDVTTPANRGMRMGIFEAMIGIGIFLGNICSSYAFYALGYTAVFGIATSCCCLSLLMSYFFVPETLENKETEGYFRGFFNASNIVDMFKSTFKRRENFDRAIILLSILLLTIYIFLINGDGSVVFLYLREKFQWTLEHYTLFNSAGNTVWILGTIFGIYFLHKLLNITESVLILVGFLSMCNGHLIAGFATQDWHIYMASAVKCLGGVLSPMTRSLVSKLVPAEEIGKIFGMIITSESLFGILGSPIYTLIYNSTIKKDPSIFCFVTAGIYLFEVIITMIIIILQLRRLRHNYNRLNNEEVNGDIATSSGNT
ncbi:proton-coupled folate transporter isoform X2 [Aethina tumida]|uniref:proton-coupled folate transporter isoform X2 n=1 Tax=Aethina tumida TaxID=116153 RepID=UPI0021487FCA|nr:proton-coupled folate transporter isoform X2 [Aethina tumida]